MESLMNGSIGFIDQIKNNFTFHNKNLTTKITPKNKTQQKLTENVINNKPPILSDSSKKYEKYLNNNYGNNKTELNILGSSLLELFDGVYSSNNGNKLLSNSKSNNTRYNDKNICCLKKSNTTTTKNDKILNANNKGGMFPNTMSKTSNIHNRANNNPNNKFANFFSIYTNENKENIKPIDTSKILKERKIIQNDYYSFGNNAQQIIKKGLDIKKDVKKPKLAKNKPKGKKKLKGKGNAKKNNNNNNNNNTKYKIESGITIDSINSNNNCDVVSGNNINKQKYFKNQGHDEHLGLLYLTELKNLEKQIDQLLQLDSSTKYALTITPKEQEAQLYHKELLLNNSKKLLQYSFVFINTLLSSYEKKDYNKLKQKKEDDDEEKRLTIINDNITRPSNIAINNNFDIISEYHMYR